MVWAAIAAQAVPAILGSGSGGGGLLGGLLGGGKTEVSQSSNNTTNVSLTSLLSNQSPNAAGGDAGGGASGSAQSASGSDAPLLPSPNLTPLTGFDNFGAEDNFNAGAETGASNKAILYAGAAVVAGLGVFTLIKKGK